MILITGSSYTIFHYKIIISTFQVTSMNKHSKYKGYNRLYCISLSIATPPLDPHYILDTSTSATESMLLKIHSFG